jgi:hypothetical protein
MGELTDVTNRAQGFAFLPMIWSWGVIGYVAIATLFTLTQTTSQAGHRWLPLSPSRSFPAPVRSSFWGDYPYFLPSLVAAMFAALTFMMILLFLNEVSR